MKKIIAIALLFISIISFSQINDTWDAVKIGTTDMSRIYVGDKLVWQKSDVCEYGDLSNYNVIVINSSYASVNCGSYAITSLTTAKQALDDWRTPSCNSTFGGTLCAIIDITINNYVLHAQYPDIILCEVMTGDVWRILGTNFTTGNAPIVHIENGVITYVEYY